MSDSHDLPPEPAPRRRALLLALAAVPAVSRAIEEPAYTVERRIGEAEVRLYAPYLVAEVLMAGLAEDAGSAAFPILLAYISGRNRGERKLQMTAPVTQSAAPLTLAMAAPVTRSSASGGTQVRFVLPAGVTMASAPEPLDPRVQLRELPPTRVAALRYPGRWTAANDAEHLAQLREAMAAAGLASAGEPVFAKYNAPFTPWFLRRNEVWLPLP